jgi:ribose-phosphate pyrophosphokinase
MSVLNEMKGVFEKVPVGPLGVVALDNSKELGELINNRLFSRRKELAESVPELLAYPDFLRENYLISHRTQRFATGEGKAVINESVRGHDIFILADIGNYSQTFKMFGMDCPMSPDNHFQDLKRVIAAISGKARRINVIMPLLYEGRQHKRMNRESLDCAIALQELERLGVENILTFDAHDPRVQNAIPLKGFENLQPTYQIIKALINTEKDLKISKDTMMVISPDEGGINRSLYFASMLGLDLGLFYKRRDYTRIVNGRNPIVKHEFLGDSVSGKDILIVDDLISSGESTLDVAKQLKRRNARNIYVAVTFALFTEGIQEYQECYEKGIIKKVFATNLTYRSEELKRAAWYSDVDVSKFIGYIIDTLNYDQSLSLLMDPSEKIRKVLEKNNINQR